MVAPWIIAIPTLIPVIFLKFTVGRALKGTIGMIIKAAIGIGAAIGAAFLAGICPALGLIVAVIAIILGEFFGALGVFLGQHIPWIGPQITTAISPISSQLWLILILSAVLFVVNIISILGIIPVIGTVIMILDIAIPIVIIAIIWGSYVNAIGGIGKCFGGEAMEIPLTGGIRIGTGS